MSDVSDKTRVALARMFDLYFTAHSCHWNVEGIEFPELHKFFGKLYGDAFDAVDGLAEQIRALDEYAPTSLTELTDRTAKVPLGTADMIAALDKANAELIAALNYANAAAVTAGKAGLSNHLQGLIEAHQKWAWMLRAMG